MISLFITGCAPGCAVAQHCYNGDVSFLWEKWKLWPPVKSKLLIRLTHNLWGLITSTRGTFVPNLVKIRSKGWNITFCVTFLFFFSRTNVEKRHLDGFWRAMAQKTRNRAWMCLFGVITWKIEIWPIFTPKTLKIWPWIGNFQPKWWNMKLPVYQKVLNQSRWHRRSASKVISPFIIFAVFDVSFRRYKL